MQVQHISEIAGQIFPAGRETKVLVGPGALVEAEHFVMGHVRIYPGGSVPEHQHEQEEVYFIAEGEGILILDKVEHSVRAGSYVYIPPRIGHSLVNRSQRDMAMIFCYSPKGIVGHWREELEKVEVAI
jgi:quercetin dioxygenase-like cupin family protein